MQSYVKNEYLKSVLKYTRRANLFLKQSKSALSKLKWSLLKNRVESHSFYQRKLKGRREKTTKTRAHRQVIGSLMKY